MSQVVEIPGLKSAAEAEQRAEDFRIDDVPVEIVPQPGGTFTVRATYPDDVHIPGALFNLSPSSPPTPHAPPAAPAAATPGAKKLGAKRTALIKAFESCMKAV